jgi:hypothetical protein
MTRELCERTEQNTESPHPLSGLNAKQRRHRKRATETTGEQASRGEQQAQRMSPALS